MQAPAGAKALARAGLWARQGSNLRPLACKARALPLSYAPGAPRVIKGPRPTPPSQARGEPLDGAAILGAATQAASDETASFQPDCCLASPGWLTSVKAIE